MPFFRLPVVLNLALHDLAYLHPRLHAWLSVSFWRHGVRVAVLEELVVVRRGDDLVLRVDRHPLPVRVVALQPDVRDLGLPLAAVVAGEEERERGDIGERRAAHVDVALARLLCLV